MIVDTANMISNADMESDLSKSIESKKRLASPLSTPERVTKASKTKERYLWPNQSEIVVQWMESYESEHKPLDGMKMALALLDLDLSSAKKTGEEEAQPGEIAADGLDASISRLSYAVFTDRLQEKLKCSEESAKACLESMHHFLAVGETWEFMTNEKRFKATYAIARDVLTCLYYKPELCLRINDCRGYDFWEGEKREIYKLGETSKYHADGWRSKSDPYRIWNEDDYEGLIHVVKKLNGGEGYEQEAERDMVLFLETVFPPEDIGALFGDDEEIARAAKVQDILSWIQVCESEHKGSESLMMASALLTDENGERTSDVTKVENMKRSEASARDFLQSMHDKMARRWVSICPMSKELVKAGYSCLLDVMTCLYYNPEIVTDHIELYKEEGPYFGFRGFKDMEENGGKYAGCILVFLDDTRFPYGGQVIEDMIIFAAAVDVFPPPGIAPEETGKADTPVEETDDEAEAGDEKDGDEEYDDEDEASKETNIVDEAEEGAKEVNDDE
ncbi:hypothetical protein MBLNU457_3584t2 [Dothideomycetes sp. NU457]